MVPGAGLEPARYCYRGILSPLRLPISPPGQGHTDRLVKPFGNGGAGRNRTDDRGVAVHCITTLLRRLKLSLYYLLLYYLSSVILKRPEES